MSEMGVRYSANDWLIIPCRKEYDSDGLDTLEHSVTANFCIDNSPFKIRTIISIGSVQRLKSYLKSKTGVELIDNDDTFKGVDGITFPILDDNGVGYVVIWMPKFEWTISNIETMSHEATHASILIMRQSGVKSKIFTAKNDNEVDDEGLAYKQSSMFRVILTELAKRQHSIFRKNIT